MKIISISVAIIVVLLILSAIFCYRKAISYYGSGRLNDINVWHWRSTASLMVCSTVVVIFFFYFLISLKP